MTGAIGGSDENRADRRCALVKVQAFSETAVVDVIVDAVDVDADAVVDVDVDAVVDGDVEVVGVAIDVGAGVAGVLGLVHGLDTASVNSLRSVGG